MECLMSLTEELIGFDDLQMNAGDYVTGKLKLDIANYYCSKVNSTANASSLRC